MDKFSLEVNIPITMWKKENQLETFLFEALACKENILETKELLLALDKAAFEMENFSIKFSQGFNSKMEQLNRLEDLNTFWEHSHKIITSLPIDAPQLRKMLILRGKIFFNNGYLENAVKDYEICVHIGQINNTMFLEELGYLIESYFNIGEHEKFESSVNLFKKEYNKELKATRSKRSKKKDNIHLPVIIQYEDKLKSFKRMQELINIKLPSNYLGETNDERKFTPYQGFKGSLDERISSASVACTVITEQNNKKKYEKILANRFIPFGEIIAFEKPLEREFYKPILQCEYCYQLTTILYTCFNCHQKYYCCLECLKLDSLHQYECSGLRNVLLYTLEATTVFRLLIKCLCYVRTHVFNKYWKASDIHDFFELVTYNIKYGPQAKIKKLMTNFDNYDTVDHSDIYSMSTYAFRIAVYAVYNTTILDDFFTNVEFEKPDLLIFIASLLLRIQNQMKINSVELGYQIIHPENLANFKFKLYQSETFEPKFIDKKKIRSIFGYCDYSKEEASYEAEELIISFHNKIEIENNTNYSKKIELPFKLTRKFVDQAYRDNVGDVKSEFSRVEKLRIALQSTKEILHLRMHTFNTNLSDSTSAITMLGVYPTITRFKHSCESNATPILLESGSLIMKACRDISPGEEITLSYMVEYKSYSNFARKHLLNSFKFRCSCKFCTNNIDFWEINNAIICYKCKNVIFESKCELCDVDKLKTSALYKEICRSIRNTARNVEEQNEMKSLKYFILFYTIQTLIYSESHHSSFFSKLEFGLICAKKNFVRDAYETLRKFVYQIPLILTEWNYQHLVYLCMVLDNLTCLLIGNICHNKSFVQSNFDLFYDVWKLTNEVAKKLIFKHDFLEIFNVITYSVLTHYQILIQMKFMLFDLEFESLTIPINRGDEIFDLPILNSENKDEYIDEIDAEYITDSDTESIIFSVKQEDLLSISSVSNLIENNVNCQEYNFISPDITERNNVVEDTHLKTILQMEECMEL